MIRRIRSAATVALTVLALAACAAPPGPRLVDPFPLRFPLAEAGAFEIDGHVAGQPWAKDGIVHYRTREGTTTALVVSSGAVLRRSAPDSPVPDAGGPAGGPVLARDGAWLRAYDEPGRPRWEFRARGTIMAEPARAGSGLYFGDEARTFYSLGAAKGRVRWRRRLQGAPVHPAVVGRRTLAVAASNSVVYILSRRGGSILSWETVPSRVVYPPAPAGSLVLVSSASPTVTALDLETGRRVGQYEASGPLVAGAVWSAPNVVLFVEDEASGRQQAVVLRSR